MTAKILSFDAAKRAKQVPQKKKKAAKPPKTNAELFEDVYADIIDEWQLSALNNSLNEFLRKKIPAHARGLETTDFTSDLNALANAESRLGMRVSIFHPDISGAKGWLVSFHLGKDVYSAPPLMATEAYARAMNILLFVELTSQLKKLKRL